MYGGMGTSSAVKGNNAGGKRWKLLDAAAAALLGMVALFLLLVFTPLGDPVAESGREVLRHDRQERRGNIVPLCAAEMVDYMPCQDPKRSARYSRERNIYRERHCPNAKEKLQCRIPAPRDYRLPVRWPDSLSKVWYSNMPYEKIAERKGHQGWMKREGEYFLFPGGGTMFPGGAWQYIEKLEEYIPLADGQIRTALDAGCGVASFGAYMLRKDVLTMSFAPRDSHKAQIQFALERGIPAFVAMLGTQRLPFSSRSFDLAHCSRCLINFSAYNGSYMIEMDRLLRPGGYFVLSGPPVGWKQQEAAWKELLDLAERMCYRLVVVDNNIAIWQKSLNFSCYDDRVEQDPPVCDNSDDPDAAWYSPLRTCTSRFPRDAKQLPLWPSRLYAAPTRFTDLYSSHSTFSSDSQRWKRRLKHYKDVVLRNLGSSRYRNIMDMNAGYGGLAAALAADPVWVMNVVPTNLTNTLPIIVDRGLIGVVHDWCEAFSTYPRTYDLLHASEMESLIRGRCDLRDVMLEMDRILRPQGTVLVRDSAKALVKVADVAQALGWKGELLATEAGVNGRERLFIATKPLTED